MLIHLLIGIIIAVVVFWIIKLFMDIIPIGAPFRSIIYAILGLIFLLVMLDILGVYHFGKW